MEICLACGKVSEKMKSCSICTKTFGKKSCYCSKECQNLDWKKLKLLHTQFGVEGAKRYTCNLKRCPESCSSAGRDQIDDCDRMGLTSLMKSVLDCCNCEPVLEGFKAKLMGSSIDEITAVDKSGFTVLHRAVMCKKVQVVEILLSNFSSALIDETNSRGSTPLCLACENGDLEIVKMLVKYGGTDQIGKVLTDGSLCLHIASQN